MAQRILKYLIAGNWKMNKVTSEAIDFSNELVSKIGRQTDVNVAVCAPFTALAALGKVFSNANIGLGAQNMHYESSGAFTGEISAPMLRELFVTHVILGHSERRQYFNETNEAVNKKVLAALHAMLRPIICVGETIEQRESYKTIEVVGEQIEIALKDVETSQSDRIVIAYEPVWAIGTGITATPEMAQDIHQAIRGILQSRFGKKEAGKIAILYGGSMKPDNAEALLAQPDIDGGLIGGASLDLKSFVSIVQIAKQLMHI